MHFNIFVSMHSFIEGCCDNSTLSIDFANTESALKVSSTASCPSIAIRDAFQESCDLNMQKLEIVNPIERLLVEAEDHVLVCVSFMTV